MADQISNTQSAKLSADYWVTLARSEEPDEWTVRLLGPSPLIGSITAVTEQDARAGAARFAMEYFRENHIDATVPEPLRWSATTKMSFKVPV